MSVTITRIVLALSLAITVPLALALTLPSCVMLSFLLWVFHPAVRVVVGGLPTMRAGLLGDRLGFRDLRRRSSVGTE